VKKEGWVIPSGSKLTWRGGTSKLKELGLHLWGAEYRRQRADTQSGRSQRHFFVQGSQRQPFGKKGNLLLLAGRYLRAPGAPLLSTFPGGEVKRRNKDFNGGGKARRRATLEPVSGNWLLDFQLDPKRKSRTDPVSGVRELTPSVSTAGEDRKGAWFG